ncbi:hypothetical protein TWF569_001508 [Orbilia oligospora]|uniref:Uncharacterized protein n=1 Tax=Orbilia oligospora TaxID=2813651 RepID=A0A7C8IZZ2_ORBOL|nr:hypothetical protein TWF102_011702 [Orbilia oligospora]KAF3112976.1 hypothetical protein TWF706_009990 [Orbilia oligospora]KAF3129285.1 hypothetical protein TWF594_011045 [Orbilia oligospora]KAF3142866.1 hypothetical protein TWF703_000370 [Orbilia oligospora]KAF3153921.1 hypothetical protein TWF569_001508 [Orbilia oligospora]
MSSSRSEAWSRTTPTSQAEFGFEQTNQPTGVPIPSLSTSPCSSSEGEDDDYDDYDDDDDEEQQEE